MTLLAHGYAIAVIDGFENVSRVVEYADIDGTTHSTPVAFVLAVDRVGQ